MDSSPLFSKPNAVILTHLGLGDNITAIPIVRYLRTRYSSVKVITKVRNAANVRDLYADDPNISVVPYPYNIECLQGFQLMYEPLKRDHDIITAGVWHRGYHPWDYLPFNFYDDIGIPYNVFWEYFQVNNPHVSIDMHVSLDSSSYAFIHNTSSTGKVFDVDAVCSTLGIDKETTVIVNPASNAYPAGHKYHDIASRFVNKPFIHYVETIKNADYIIMSDSSFFCLAMQMPLKTEKCYLYARGGTTYPHIWSEKYGYNSGRQQRRFSSIT